MTLEMIRKEIDTIDQQMKELFLRRMECARKVAEEKKKTGGEVYVPAREEEIIKKRTEGVEEVKEEYTEFLRHLMSVSRRYQYRNLTEMQNEVIAQGYIPSKCSANGEDKRLKICFHIDKNTSDFALFAGVLRLNGIRTERMSLVTEEEAQAVEMIVEGNIDEEKMRWALCQIGKEALDISIMNIDEK